MRFIKIFIAVITVYSISALAIQVGDTAPQFSLSTNGGGTFDLAQEKGKVTVLVFFCVIWPPVMTVGPMVEDSIVKKFSGSSISVAGVDMWSATDSDIKRLIDTTHITFPVAKNGISIGSSYSISFNIMIVSIVVIDKDGFVQFVQRFENQMDSTTYKKMVSDAVLKVRSLLETGVIMPKATAVFAGRNGANVSRYYTLSGQLFAHQNTTVGTRIVVRRLNGRVTGVFQCGKPNQ